MALVYNVNKRNLFGGEKLENNLREMREKRNLTQAQLAEKVGISQQAYSQIEKGDTNPSLETALKISSALKISMGKIFSLQKQV